MEWKTMLINFKGIKVIFLTKECFNNLVEVGLSEKHEAEKQFRLTEIL